MYPVNDWRDDTSPLSNETINDICFNLDLYQKSKACSSEIPIYASDIFADIESSFVKDQNDFEYVQSKLSKYLVYLEDSEFGGKYTSFGAWYDFQGDGMTALIFIFEGTHEKNVLRWFSQFYWEPGNFKAGEG
ncbi:MAG TPA: hypothetical protein DIW23_06150 [Anaerolineae bacterium]|nr:hypothetical protein [Anaerolineae bacterium]